MFLQNEFTTEYYSLMNLANSRVSGNSSRRQAKEKIGYVERHHIIPKSFGGSNEDSNLVWLTASEHLEAHILLTKMLEPETANSRKMFAAAVRMLNPQSKTQQRILDKGYDDIRNKCAQLHSEFMKIKHKGIHNPFFNKKHTEESKHKISLGGKGLKRNDTTRQNLSVSKMGDKNPARQLVKCPHCDKEGMSGGMRKHHFEHCKKRGN